MLNFCCAEWVFRARTRQLGQDGSSQGPLQPGCVVKEPCCFRQCLPMRRSLVDWAALLSVTAGSFATEGQPNAI